MHGYGRKCRRPRTDFKLTMPSRRAALRGNARVGVRVSVCVFMSMGFMPKINLCHAMLLGINRDLSSEHHYVLHRIDNRNVGTP